jgi:hypothetical protein
VSHGSEEKVRSDEGGREEMEEEKRWRRRRRKRREEGRERGERERSVLEWVWRKEGD